MATAANPPPGVYGMEDYATQDPFSLSVPDARHQRHSAFDASQSSIYLNGSPDQAKRALQAHLSETNRRLQEASVLGKALVQQKQELEDRMKEVDEQQTNNDIGPELRRRLAEIEKEFNEVGRETARAFLPKSRVPSGETDAGAGASVYSSEAHHSPTKVSVPSRKQRNQQPSRINDIALATEISTSLLAQLKETQALLVEKEEHLKTAALDKSLLELENEGLQQRVRSMDESESRLKDDNWNLETQVRELQAAAKAATDRENRVNHSLNLARTEKSTVERELEELKQLYTKLQDDHVSKAKHHEAELSALRRDVNTAENERGSLQRKIDELNMQNQELAKIAAYRMREQENSRSDHTSPDDDGENGNTLTPNGSPPPSPTKPTPRHGQLESETLKHSLHHAHRMIQQLKNNIHREKTEKLELKRMLQDARDDLENARSDTKGLNPANKRRKNDTDAFKKPSRPDRLGAFRATQEAVVEDDDEWEEQESSMLQLTPSKKSRRESMPGAFPGGFSSAAETGTETSDAFETANELEGANTETDAFQTGAETLDGDSTEELTETENMGTIRARPLQLTMPGNRNSFQSTASTSADEMDDFELLTPSQSHQQRYKLKMRNRRTTPRGTLDIFNRTPQASPPSISTSNASTPAHGRSLFAELGGFSGAESEDGSFIEGTPSRASLVSLESSPEAMRKAAIGKSPLQAAFVPKQMVIMVDSETMTDPEPVSRLGISAVTSTAIEPASTAQPALSLSTQVTSQATEPVASVPPQLSLSSQILSSVIEPIAAIVPTLSFSSGSSSQTTEPLASTPPALTVSSGTQPNVTEPIAPTPPSLTLSPSVTSSSTSPIAPVQPPLRVSSLQAQTTDPKSHLPAPLSFSEHSAHGTEPRSVAQPALNMSEVSAQITDPRSAVAPVLQLSAVSTQDIVPVDAEAPVVKIPSLMMSTVSQQATEPRESVHNNVGRSAPASSLVSLATQNTEPVESSPALQTASVSDQTQPRQQETLGLSNISSQATDPVVQEARKPELSQLFSQATEPVMPQQPTIQISVLSPQTTAPVEAARPVQQLSNMSSHITHPVEAPRPMLNVSGISNQVVHPVEARTPVPQISEVSYLTTHPVESARAVPQLSELSFQTTSPVETPRPVALQVSDTCSQETQPVEAKAAKPEVSLSSMISQDTAPVEVVSSYLNMGFSDIMVHQDTQPELPTLPSFLPMPSRPSTANKAPQISLNFSSFFTQETEPEIPSRPVTAHRTSVLIDAASPASEGYFSRSTSSREPKSLAQSGIMSTVVEPTSAVATNGINGVSSRANHAPMVDEGTQTMVSADQMDKLLTIRSAQRSNSTTTAIVDARTSPPASPRKYSQENRPRRLSSSSSVRSRIISAPPLPPDHKEVIAAAALKAPIVPTSAGEMGPPTIPASAYKQRPQTPTIRPSPSVITTSKTGSLTPRAQPRQARSNTGKSDAASSITRQSSVSSFASDVERRLNPGANPFGQAFNMNNTDPRMIQAITQTMIGEFLWKYTRKTGSESMSEKRHRRFFWVHPYTRTLYWSETDPQTAGKVQLKAKSVAIQAVRVVPDDNMTPPGLHRKSILVITPGRTIKFTATTSQRHDTWYNALSYLLLRTADGEQEDSDERSEIRDEFNPAFRATSRQSVRSRASSFFSHRTSSPFSHRAASPANVQVPTLRRPVTPGRRAISTEPGQEPASGRLSSLSGMLQRPGSALRNSFTSTRRRTDAQDVSAYEPSETSSHYDLTHELAAKSVRDREHLAGMENVRACCDGKHDVGHLHTHKSARHSSSFYNMSLNSRSQSRADSYKD